MRFRTWAVALTVCLFGVVAARADVIFQDDFNTGSEPDASLWTQTESSGCSVTLSGGHLVATFTGAGAPRSAYAVSPVFDLPDDWTELTLTGQWAFTTPVYGECVIQMFDPDTPATFVQATYVSYPSKRFRSSYTGYSVEDLRGSFPTTLTDFTMTVTPTGWSFTTEDGSISKSFSTPVMAGLDQVQFKIGGWEYSAVTNVAQFDNIAFAPEPATLGLLAIGATAALLRRRGR